MRDWILTCHSHENTDSKADEENDVDHNKLSLAQGIQPHLYRTVKKIKFL